MASGQDFEFSPINENAHRIHMPDASEFPEQQHSTPSYNEHIHPLGTQRSLTEPIDTVIYFMDKVAVNFQVIDGQHATAGYLFELALEDHQNTYMGLPPDARDIFALWLISDHLELQLKPSQVPFKLVCMWDDLLRKYTSLSSQEIDRDEPVIMFERNVFYPRAEEKKIENQECLRLLYHEARENVIDGKYPVSDSMSDVLAGIQAMIICRGQYDSKEHTADYYRDKLKDYYPPTKISATSSLFGKGSAVLAQRLADSHRDRYREMAPNRNGSKMLYRRYLEECWKLPFYGAAYFAGQVEHPARRSMFSNPDDPVYLAINTEGVFIIDMDDVVFLVGVLYSELRWTYAVPSEDKKEHIPCLFIKFQCDEACHSGQVERVTKIFQVFTKQASLADTLMQTCKKIYLTQGPAVNDELDMIDGIKDGMIRSEDKVWGQFDKLCMITHRASDQTLKGNVRGFKNQTLAKSPVNTM